MQIEFGNILLMEIKHNQHNQTFPIEMRFLKRLVPIFGVVDHTAHKPFLYQQFCILGRLLQRSAFEFGVDQSEVGFLSEVYVVLEKQFLYKLSQSAFALMLVCIGRKVTQAPVYQLLTIVKY